MLYCLTEEREEEEKKEFAERLGVIQQTYYLLKHFVRRGFNISKLASIDKSKVQIDKTVGN